MKEIKFEKVLQESSLEKYNKTQKLVNMITETRNANTNEATYKDEHGGVHVDDTWDIEGRPGPGQGVNPNPWKPDDDKDGSWRKHGDDDEWGPEKDELLKIKFLCMNWNKDIDYQTAIKAWKKILRYAPLNTKETAAIREILLFLFMPKFSRLKSFIKGSSSS